MRTLGAYWVQTLRISICPEVWRDAEHTCSNDHTCASVRMQEICERTEMCAEIMINYFFIKTKLVNWFQGELNCCHGFV